MNSNPAGANPAGWNLVLSYGDLSRESGYRTRILGELEHLDAACGLTPYLLVLDRQPELFRMPLNVRHCAMPRSAPLRFFRQAARLRRVAPIRVVHAHNLYSAALALVGRDLYGYKVVLDYHGRIPEEYVYLGKKAPGAHRLLEALEVWAVSGSDHVIVVSEALRDYIVERHHIPAQRLSVIPCCADSRIFRYNSALRAQTRAKLGLADRLVCTHLGSFFEWYESDRLVRVFQNLHARQPSAHLLVVTPADDKVRTYLAGALDPALFTVISALHEEVPALLNASDLGFLLLKSSPNIKTSSPAKFAEYLNCGLPVVITPGVGDFSNLVMKERTGEVLSRDSISQTLLNDVLHDREAVAQQCVKAGQGLTWQAVGACLLAIGDK